MSKKKKSKNSDEDEITFKVITLGNSNVGKSSIIKRFIYDKFETKTISAIGFGTFNKEIELKDGTKVILNLIDTAGQENYKALSVNYIKNADGVLLVYANDDRKSFEDIAGWIDSFIENTKIDLGNQLPAYLVENKKDSNCSVIDKEEIENLINKYHIYGYIEVSTKDGYNIKEAFQNMAEMFIKIYGKKKNKENLKLIKSKRKKNGCNCDK